MKKNKIYQDKVYLRRMRKNKISRDKSRARAEKFNNMSASEKRRSIEEYAKIYMDILRYNEKHNIYIINRKGIIR